MPQCESNWLHNMTEKQDVVKFLQRNGVETRFVSILDEKVYVNNLKLSRFSRKKEEIFLTNFPNYNVRRSKVFQKICTRASRVLKDALRPGDKILILSPVNCVNKTVQIVLEPYTRKYGVELMIIPEPDFKDIQVPSFGKKEFKADSVALPLTLDGEVENILDLMIHGEKLELLSSQTENKEIKTIYPLINVPRSWIESWIEIEGLSCVFEDHEGLPKEMLEFLEDFIPDVREKIMRSAVYIKRNVNTITQKNIN